MGTIKLLPIRRILILLGLVLFSVSFLSCSSGMTKEEKMTVEKYTNQEEHDSLIYGRWMSHEIWMDRGKEMKTAISFDDKGIQKDRMYHEGEPRFKWIFRYYYYTKQGKVFLYSVAEKGFGAMTGESFLEIDYKVSADGKTLMFGDKTYEKMN